MVIIATYILEFLFHSINVYQRLYFLLFLFKARKGQDHCEVLTDFHSLMYVNFICSSTHKC